MQAFDERRDAGAASSSRPLGRKITDELEALHRTAPAFIRPFDIPDGGPGPPIDAGLNESRHANVQNVVAVHPDMDLVENAGSAVKAARSAVSERRPPRPDGSDESRRR